MSLDTTGTPRSDAKDTGTLSELFDKAFELFNGINKTKEPTSSPKIQSDIKQTMNMLEDATRLVSIVDMFSENETFAEIATENIKYLLLPALLGTLTTKVCNTEDRMHVVSVAEIYFVDFLHRVKSYGLTNVAIPEIKLESDNVSSVGRTRSNAEMITEMVNQRNTKVQRFKEQKELESRLETLEKNLSNPNIDDDDKKDYFVTLIKSYINLTIDELSSLAAEKSILEHMKKVGKTETMASQGVQKLKHVGSKLQPIIITRDELQKKVYGAGYPSLPVLTVQEFYEQRVKEGDWPDASKRNKVGSKCLQDTAQSGKDNEEQEEEERKKEELVEADDPETLERSRAMDEYKDSHRRGWGNRANRS